MNQREKKAIILIALGIFIAFSILNNDNLNFNTGNSDEINLDNEYIETSAVSGIIHIDNNWTAAKGALICTGNGIYSDPYVIEDFVIDGEFSESCILIENSDVYFKIENCTVYNSAVTIEAGIRLINVSNSQLINNNCSSNRRGIFLYSSDNNTISGNTANSNPDYGILLLLSNYNTVSGNTANYNEFYGMFINNSNNNTISGNTANDNYEYGIYLFNANNNTISGNFFDFNNNFGIILSNSDNNAISGNTANNNEDDGIYLTISDYNTLSGNTANNNDDNGISLAEGYNNTISENTANYNTNGIYLFNSDSNIFSLNTLIGNDVCIYEDILCDFNVFENNECGEEDGIPFELIILISVISGGAVIGVVILLLIIRKRKRI